MERTSTDPFAWATPGVATVLRGTGPEAEDSDEDHAWLEQTATDLARALRSYHLKASLKDRRLTPNAALLSFEGSDGLTESNVESRRRQLLTTHGLRVLRVSAEPGRIVIAVPRPNRQVVSLGASLGGRGVPPSVPRANTRLLVGIREDNGRPLFLEPGTVHAPHTLIAGSTGSGKSVLLQNLLLDIAMTNDPGAARITLIDPKQGVDYQALEALPHVDGGIVVEQGEAIARLTALVEEMDRRYAPFRKAGAGVTDLARYKKKAGPGATPLPPGPGRAR